MLGVMAWLGMTVQAVTVQTQSTKPATMNGPAVEGRSVTVKSEQITRIIAGPQTK
jgi:hypothetical protein